MEENSQEVATLEEQNRKNRSRRRLFILLILFDILLVGYLIFEMIMIFKK